MVGIHRAAAQVLALAWRAISARPRESPLPNHSPDCVISRVNHPMIDFSPHHIARVRRKIGKATPRMCATWAFRPTINLRAGFFHSLSLERTRPARRDTLKESWPGRSARGR